MYDKIHYKLKKKKKKRTLIVVPEKEKKKRKKKKNVFSSNIFTLTSHGQRRLEDYSPWGHKSQT